jgi:hypothetical protein
LIGYRNDFTHLFFQILSRKNTIKSGFFKGYLLTKVNKMSLG